jgi:uncharacterized protein YgiM (DUF1202 family)
MRQFASKFMLASATLILLSAPSLAQSLSPELQTRAREACVQKAQAGGFTVKDVVSVTPSDADTVRVALNLDRNGQAFRLTCGYSASKNSAMVGDDANTATAPVQTYQPWLNPWLGILLPLLVGLPLLWAWARGHNSEEYVRYIGSHVDHAEPSEAIVRTSGNPLDVYSGPASSYRVTRNLRNGQRVTLSGQYDGDWVELSDGGWIPTQYLETSPRFVS